MSDEDEYAAVVVAGKQAVVKSARPDKKAVVAQPAALSVAGLQRPLIHSEPKPLFSTRAAEIAAQQAAAPEPLPQVPPLPFTYAGKMIEDGRYTVFLLAGERSLAVHAGEVLEQGWRVKAIKPPNMIFWYTPLKAEAVLDIGESK